MFSFKYFRRIFSFFSKSAYMNSNVNCFSDSNLISWFHDWCLDKAIVVSSSRNRYFQFLYMCDTCLDDSLIVFTFSRISEDTSSSSIIFTLWLCWFVLMFVKSISVTKVFLLEVASSRLAIDSRLCFSFVIERCRCADWIATTQLHFSNVSIFLFQSIVELCFFNQNILKTTSCVIIRTISKISFSWCRWIVIDNDFVSVFTFSFSLDNEFSSMTIKSYESSFFRVNKRFLSIRFCDMKFSVALESIIAVNRCSLTLIDVWNVDAVLTEFICFWAIMLHFSFDMLSIKKFDFFSLVWRSAAVIINIFVSVVLKLWFVEIVDDKNIAHLHKCFNQELRDEILLFDIRFFRWCVSRIVSSDTCVNRRVHIHRYHIRTAVISWSIIRFLFYLSGVRCSCRRNMLFNWINRDHHRSVSRYLVLLKRRCQKIVLKHRWFFFD